eukprot:TRINITY_DN33078_c0_g1_i1.p1 TRINITY_DN33078_c0_g1~~TRINITY_DN33078_c0_g1_i1.p1  ORF type:complete len:240 (+),score=35.60 TRINITY_DN33078_c0_g1_i1:71-790(+)
MAAASSEASQESSSESLAAAFTGKDGIVIVAGVAGAVTVSAGMLMPGLKGGGLSPGIAFPWHAVCMSISYLCLLTIGRWSYTADLRVFGDKPTRRNFHRYCMVAATGFATLGYLAIFMAHLPGKKFFGYDFKAGAWNLDKTRIAHSLLGYFVLGLMLFQVVATNIRIFPFHRYLGKAIAVAAGVNFALATYFWPWSMSFKAVVYGLTALCCSIVVLWPRADSSVEAASLVTAGAQDKNC